MKLREIQRIVEDRHQHWWHFLITNILTPPNTTPPAVKWRYRASKRIVANATSERCEYNLNYLIENPGYIDELVCHEVCHSYAARFYPRASHGYLWKFLFHKICGFRGTNHVKGTISKMLPVVKVANRAEKIRRKIAELENSLP